MINCNKKLFSNSEKKNLHLKMFNSLLENKKKYVKIKNSLSLTFELFMLLLSKRKGKWIIWIIPHARTQTSLTRNWTKKFPSPKYHSCVLKNLPVNLDVHKMLELRLLKVYQIIHMSIGSPCGLNQTVSLQLDLRTIFNSPIIGFTALHHQLGRAFILLLWSLQKGKR